MKMKAKVIVPYMTLYDSTHRYYKYNKLRERTYTYSNEHRLKFNLRPMTSTEHYLVAYNPIETLTTINRLYQNGDGTLCGRTRRPTLPPHCHSSFEYAMRISHTTPNIYSHTGLECTGSILCCDLRIHFRINTYLQGTMLGMFLFMHQFNY